MSYRDDHDAALARIATLEARVATLEADKQRLLDDIVRLRAARDLKPESLRGYLRTLPGWFIALMLLALLGFGWLFLHGFGACTSPEAPPRVTLQPDVSR